MCYDVSASSKINILLSYQLEEQIQRQRGVNAAQGTQTAFKNELLYTTFGINYSTLPAIFRKVRLPHASTAASAAQVWLVHVL